MNAASTARPDRPATPFSTTWRWVLLLFPIAVVVGLLFLQQIEVYRLRNRPLPHYGVVPAFSLTNQDNRKFSSTDLAGKVWIADFVFTSCPGPCPIISSRMGELQKPLRNTDVHLVSFSVDPERDTPAVLREYADKLKAESGRWDFLTGPASAIYDLSRNGFKLGISDGGGENGTPVHSTRFVLVDRKGVIRNYYDALAPDAVTKVLADANHLLHE
jgi:protein SCO1/2